MRASYILIAGISLFIFDRLLKFTAMHNTPEKGVFLLPGIKFMVVKNIGVAFGIKFSDLSLKLLIAGILLFLLWFIFQELAARRRISAALLIFLLIGAASNILDRFQYSFVIDYIVPPLFPAFNIADAMIIVAAAMLGISELNRKKVFKRR